MAPTYFNSTSFEAVYFKDRIRNWVYVRVDKRISKRIRPRLFKEIYLRIFPVTNPVDSFFVSMHHSRVDNFNLL